MNQTSNNKKSWKKKLLNFSLFFLGGLIIVAIFLTYLGCSFCIDANHGSAISSMRTIVGATETALATSEAGKKCVDLARLGELNLIDSRLVTGYKSGFTFKVVKSDENCEIIAVSTTKIPLTCRLYRSLGVNLSSCLEGPYSYYMSLKDKWKLHYSNDENVIANENSPD
jgi:hypothetical protein